MITERKQTEEQLRRTLADKDMLMRELQHRVKNSLNIVASLISLGEILVQQLNGKLTIESARGVTARVVFDQTYVK